MVSKQIVKFLFCLLLTGCLPEGTVPDTTQTASGGAPGSAEIKISSPPPGKHDKPNVIWILLDAARAHNFSSYGYERPTTPNMDKLAQEGVLLLQHFAQAPWTTQSVPSYMSGRYFPGYCHEPNRTDVARQRAPGEYLLPEIMQANGYHTTLITSHAWFSEWSPLAQAFDQFVRLKPAPELRAKGLYAPFEDINSMVLPWIENPPRAPFFLYIHALDTHAPYHILDPPFDKWVNKDYESTYRLHLQAVNNTKKRFTEEDKEYLRGCYDGNLLYADTHVGALIEKLEELGLRENTVIVISSDHGEMLGEDGRTAKHTASRIYDRSMHVPLILAGPGLPAGRRISSLTENADIVPTLIDLLKIETDSQTDGKSLMPLIHDPSASPVHKYVFAKRVSGRKYDGPTKYTLRSAKYKYEFFPRKETEELWEIPETKYPPKNLVKDKPKIAAQMKRYLRKHIIPLREQFLALPTLAIDLPLWEAGNSASPKEAFTLDLNSRSISQRLRTDNKWSFSRRLGYLWASSDEDAPPVSLRFEVPSGRYRVQLWVGVDKNWQNSGPASSFLAKAESDEEFRKISRTEPANNSKSDSLQWGFVELGEYVIDDGSLDIALDEGEADHWAIVKRIRLTPITSEETEEEREERLRQLRDLGYV